MKLHVFGGPWRAITPKVSAAKGKIVAAVAYVGADAAEILPLKAGDVLICDASRPSVAAGSTSVRAIKSFISSGVCVYSHPGLHAKVVLLPRRLFIGSANASAHSRDDLDEAVLEITDRDAIQQAAKFLHHLMEPHLLLTASDLDELSAIKVVRPASLPRRSAVPTTVPVEVPRLWIIASKERAWTKSSDAVYATERRRVGRIGRREGQVRIEAIEWRTDEATRLRVDDWFVHILNGRAYAPARIVKISPSTGKFSLVWSAIPSESLRSLRVSSLSAELQNLARSKDMVCWKDARNRSIFTAFRRPETPTSS